MPQTKQSFERQVTATSSLNYLLYLPPDYSAQSDWPLIIFLHGYGERGDDLELLTKNGLPKNIAAGEDYPFIIASPQCPETTTWPEQVTELNGLLDHLIEKYDVDTERVYLTGLSMGGYGTWFWASKSPERFAAIAPICGGGGWWMAQKLINMPIWVFHGDADPVVPLIESELMVNRIRTAGGAVKFTVYPGVEHDSWTETYNNPALYEWFLNYPLADQKPMHAKTFATDVTRPAELNYLLYLPPDYDSQDEWPLILFLHGRGERGSDLEAVAQEGLPKRIAAGDQFPFIVVAPQCPITSYWTEEVEALNALLDSVIAQHKVDSTRVYLTGLSMGGRGTWHLATRYPERFAAIAPICGGGGNIWMAHERLASMPTWIFHGDADPVVPVIESQRMAEWQQEAGNTNVRLTIYPGVDHDSWTRAYNDSELYEWFLSRQTT